MNLRVFRSLLFLFATFALVVVAQGRTDSELSKVAKSAFKARGEAKDDSEKIRTFRSSFDGLKDNEKIRAIAQSLFDLDEDPRWSMSNLIVMAPSYALGQDPDLISDYSELRKMILLEGDPRRFYLLSSLVPWSTEQTKYDFISERIHMLFKDGRVAKDEGEYTQSYSHDVSVYTYQVIMGNLKVLGADFEPPQKNLPHEEQVLILAKWLKVNWSGCENLEIPSDRSKTNKAGSIRSPSKTNRAENKPSTQALGTDTLANPSSAIKWSLIAAVVFMLGCLGFWIKSLRG